MDDCLLVSQHRGWLIWIFSFAGKAKGVLFEDDGDGYEFTKGGYLLTHYVAELHSSVVTIRVSETEGSWNRPKRRLHVQLLLGGGAMVHTFYSTDIGLELAFSIIYHLKIFYFAKLFSSVQTG